MDCGATNFRNRAFTGKTRGAAHDHGRAPGELPGAQGALQALQKLPAAFRVGMVLAQGAQEDPVRIVRMTDRLII